MSILLYMTGGQLSEYEGTVVFSMGPASVYGYIFPPVVGAVEVSLQPGAQYQIEHHEIGHIEISLHPQSQGAIEHHETGSIQLTLHTLRTIHYADYVYQGNIGLSLSPASPNVHDFPPVIGNVGPALTPQSSYSQEWPYQGSIPLSLAPASGHYADYLYQGAINLALIPASGHCADFVIVGSIQLVLTPASPYIQDFSYSGIVEFALIPGSSFINDFSYQGAIIFYLIPQVSGIFDRGDLLFFDVSMIREISLDAVISKTMLFIAPGITQGRELEAYISKNLAYRTAIKKEADNEAGR